MTNRVPVMRPRLPAANSVLPYLRRMDASGEYANAGPLVRELEHRYASFLGVPDDCVVATSSATLGLVGAVSVANMKRWMVPDFTFPAPGLAVLAAGAELVLVDVSPLDWVADFTSGESSLDTGLLPVMPFGQNIDVNRWSRDVDVVVDGAGSLGASVGGLTDLPSRWSVVFSLHATKVLPAGEGGLVVFGDAGRADELRRWANFGFCQTRVSEVRGLNAKMPESGAAYALASLDAWPEEADEWSAAQLTVSDAVSGIAGLSPMPGLPNVTSFHVVRFDSAALCNEAVRCLDEDGVDSRRWWDSLHAMPAFAECARGRVNVAEELASTTLGLPMFRGLHRTQAERIAHALRRALAS